MSWKRSQQIRNLVLLQPIPREWRIKTEPPRSSVMDYPKTSWIISPEELTITEMSATDLVHKMATGSLASVTDECVLRESRITCVSSY
jgi:amidase